MNGREKLKFKFIDIFHSKSSTYLSVIKLGEDSGNIKKIYLCTKFKLQSDTIH